jgi:hypothetical protein
MGTVYKKIFTKPLPADAKLIVRKGQRFAQWKDAKGKARTAPLTAAGDRIAVEAGTYTPKFRDGSGVVREVSTGCRDETAARSVLGDLERRAELVKAKVMTAAEDAVGDHQGRPLADHFAAFIDHQRAKGVASVRVSNTLTQLQRIAADCGFSTLADLDTVRLERWLLKRASEGMSAATRNQCRGAWVTFCNWCITSNPPRLLSNPFTKVPKADEGADPRRKRRSLDEDELRRLLDVARLRPLLDMMTVRRGKRRGEAFANLREETRRRLEVLGWERALIYKTLVLTGAPQGRASIALRWSIGPRRCSTVPGARRRRREVPAGRDDSASVRSCCRPSRMARTQADHAPGRRQKLPVSAVGPRRPRTPKCRFKRSSRPSGAIVSAVVCRTIQTAA